MESQTRFDLNVAVEDWRRELAGQSGFTPDARRELEAHLHDSMAGFRRHGLNEEESFRLARRRVGQPQQLAEEYEKAMNTFDTPHWNRPLAFAAWVMFVVSFFLPAFASLWGYQCATLHRAFWPQALQGRWLSIHYLLLTVANLLMLASPFLLPRFSQNARHLKWLRLLTGAALVLVWSFVLELIARKNGADLRMGCYFWSASFALLYLSTLLPAGNAVKRQMA